MATEAASSSSTASLGATTFDEARARQEFAFIAEFFQLCEAEKKRTNGRYVNIAQEIWKTMHQSNWTGAKKTPVPKNPSVMYRMIRQLLRECDGDSEYVAMPCCKAKLVSMQQW